MMAKMHCNIQMMIYSFFHLVFVVVLMINGGNDCNQSGTKGKVTAMKPQPNNHSMQ